MRPFSLGAYAARFLWDGAPILGWLAFAYYLYSLAGRFLQTPFEFTLPLVAFSLWATMHLSRPVRKFLNLTAYSWMIQSPFRILVELAIWKLLRVAHQYWHKEEPMHE